MATLPCCSEPCCWKTTSVSNFRLSQIILPRLHSSTLSTVGCFHLTTECAIKIICISQILSRELRTNQIRFHHSSKECAIVPSFYVHNSFVLYYTFMTCIMCQKNIPMVHAFKTRDVTCVI